MTIKHVTLNSIIPAKNTIVDGVVIDGYVDGQPMQFVRTADNRVKPSIGTTVHTSYGVGTVTRYSRSNRIVVAISQFNDDFEFAAFKAAPVTRSRRCRWAAPSLPRTGRVACSLIFLTRSRSAILVMSVLGFLFASYWEFSLVDMQRTGKRRTARFL